MFEEIGEVKDANQVSQRLLDIANNNHKQLLFSYLDGEGKLVTNVEENEAFYGCPVCREGEYCSMSCQWGKGKRASTIDLPDVKENEAPHVLAIVDIMRERHFKRVERYRKEYRRGASHYKSRKRRRSARSKMLSNLAITAVKDLYGSAYYIPPWAFEFLYK